MYITVDRFRLLLTVFISLNLSLDLPDQESIRSHLGIFEDISIIEMVHIQRSLHHGFSIFKMADKMGLHCIIASSNILKLSK